MNAGHAWRGRRSHYPRRPGRRHPPGSYVSLKEGNMDDQEPTGWDTPGPFCPYCGERVSDPGKFCSRSCQEGSWRLIDLEWDERGERA